MRVEKKSVYIVDRLVDKKGYASIKVTGNVHKVFACTGKMPDAQEGVIRKLNGDEYLDTRTGEIKLYNHFAENRSDNVESVRKSMVLIRDTINCNITDPDKVRWCTLTYAENMTDNVQLRKDFNRFCTRFERYSVDRFGSKPLHIAVPEPQGRGAWHLHILFWWPELDRAPFIPSSEVYLDRIRKELPEGTRSLEDLWGHGFTSVKPLQSCDNVGAYLTAYLTDLPLEDADFRVVPADVVEKDVLTVSGSTVKKKFVKGARLYRYPNGMKLLWASQHLVKPTLEKMTFGEAMKKEKASGATETFSGGFALTQDGGCVQRYMVIHQFNIKAQKNQANVHTDSRA